MKREEFKDIELSGRRWRVERFDALTGSYISYLVMTKMLPMLMGVKSAEGEAGQIDAMTSGLMAGKNALSKEEFISLQKDCLSAVRELKMVGSVETPIAVMMQNGSWGVEGLDKDVMTVLALTIHALLFNVSSFFDESALKGVMGSIQGYSLFSAKT